MKKPEIVQVKTINLIEMLNYCEQFRPGLKDRMWEYLNQYGLRNDSYLSVSLDLYHNIPHKTPEQLEETQRDIVLIMKEFPEVKDDIVFWVCW